MDTPKPTYIMQEQWDYLIILDACRYDYFKEVYRRFFQNGTLIKAHSVASTTLEWRSKTFNEYHNDLIYISANPYISEVTVKKFTAADHFFKVFDLVAHDWDAQICTVRPEKVTEQALKAIKAYPTKRAMIHYIQPHEPYLTRIVEQAQINRERPNMPWAEQGGVVARVLDGFLKLLSGLLFNFGLRQRLIIWKLREFLNLPPKCPMDAVRRKYGKAKLRQAYRENLELVLGQVAKLIEHLSGRIIVTADHGEALGERGLYGHWTGAKISLLREVPWFVIEKQDAHPTEIKTKPGQKKSRDNGQQKIRERLNALGYY